ncbi:flavodoxin domain-containing protein [bacterium]|nr:flavodoxin domain-containing protein [bacterium]
MKILLLYYTKTGHTLEAANATVTGIRSAGAEVDLVNVKDFNPGEMTNYDALIVASPCHAGSLTEGIAKPIKKALQSLEPVALQGKRCGGISVNSGTGGERTVKSIGAILTAKGCQEYLPGPVAKAGVPLSLWKGPSVSHSDEAIFRTYGTQFLTPEIP